MAYLRKMALLAAVLSIIAGIFGMHVISPGHSTQHQATTHHQANPEHLEQCSCSGDCTSVEATPASCTLSNNTTSLAAPFPGSTWVGANTNARAADLVTAYWAFHPSSPSPGELSISRT